MKKYSRFFEDKLPGGKGDNKSDSEFDPKQLSMGVEIESEHTADPELELEIAKDHLSEIPDYYSRLKKMERDAMSESVTYEEETLTERLLEMIEKVKANLLDVAEISTELNDYATRTGNMGEESQVIEELVLRYKGSGDRLVKALYKSLTKEN